MKVAIIAVAAILLLLILWYIATYNGFVKLRNFVQESWRQIDVELKRRRDLIPNLVETVKGYAKHESGTLEAVTQARVAWRRHRRRRLLRGRRANRPCRTRSRGSSPLPRTTRRCAPTRASSISNRS